MFTKVDLHHLVQPLTLDGLGGTAMAVIACIYIC
jgi:hypothetical protein